MSFFSSGSRQHGSLYFAYGSNLYLTQMANRCPASVFKGKAVLSGYRWQINERGVANVVQSIDDSVEGLLYLVNPKDERALDRSEGVAKGFYQKHLLTVTFEPHRQFENRESFEVAQLISQPEATKETTGLKSQGPSDVLHQVISKNLTDQNIGESNPNHAKKQEEPNLISNVKALVYVSEKYTSDGIIREEYILRMRKAILDAEIMGMSRSFVDKYITPCLDKRNEVLPRSHGDDGSAKANSKRMKVIEKHEGQMSQKPRSQFYEANTGSLDLVDFQWLEQANRGPHADSGLEFPTDMLDAIKSARSKASRDEYRMTYIVVAHKDNGDSTPRFDILATSWDLDLANELAIKHFRDACSRSFPSITTETRHHWAKSDNANTQPGAFKWKLDEDAYIRLDATVPSSDRITVRVDAQKLSARS
ncbi:hypothetical protein E0Z10_g8704 [Xylaria hypoxylon]|uniref:gamma-glutamylcyclotransferase n=1 Tax=Xylaria hypoxylon TaxID=37992 RepID=A0A4Z0YKZ5_9PEZI|nr:hypothetical protein E0Z10_g8704 [Xylaria hypoxylon]